jgi:transcription antitermination factor NusA-like protein
VHKAELEIKRMILDMPRSLTQEFMVPDYACGRIIGRGGGNIKEISLMSNCKVMVHRESMSMENVSNCRGSIGPIALNYENAKLLSLSGSVEQIEMAKVKIQNAFNSFVLPPFFVDPK